MCICLQVHRHHVRSTAQDSEQLLIEYDDIEYDEV